MYDKISDALIPEMVILQNGKSNGIVPFIVVKKLLSYFKLLDDFTVSFNILTLKVA